jgi:hypothetical protein
MRRRRRTTTRARPSWFDEIARCECCNAISFPRPCAPAAATYRQNHLLGVVNGEPGNAQAIQWALRNRSRAASGWHHDSVKLEHSGPGGSPVQVEPVRTIDVRALSPEQRAQFKAILLT